MLTRFFFANFKLDECASGTYFVLHPKHILPIPRQLMVWRAYVLPVYWRLLTFYYKRTPYKQTEGSELAQSAVLWKLVLKKTGPHWKTHFENSSFCKTYLENSSKNDQCRRFIAAVDSKPMSLSWMRWQSQADIAGDQPMSLTVFLFYWLMVGGAQGPAITAWSCQLKLYGNIFGATCSYGPFASRYHLHVP